MTPRAAQHMVVLFHICPAILNVGSLPQHAITKACA